MFTYLDSKDLKTAFIISKLGYEGAMRVLHHTINVEGYEEAQVATSWSWVRTCLDLCFEFSPILLLRLISRTIYQCFTALCAK